MQSHNLKLKPDECVYMLSIGVVLHRLSISRAKVLDELFDLNGEAAQSFEEACARELAGLDLLRNMKFSYLRPDEHPRLARKLESLRSYIDIYSPQQKRGHTCSIYSFSDYEGISERIYEIARAKNLDTKKIDPQQLTLRFLAREKPEGKVHIPVFLSDMARHYRFTENLTHYDTSINGGLSSVIKIEFSSTENTLAQTKKEMGKALKNIAGKRLDITPVSYPIMSIDTGWGDSQITTQSGKKLTAYLNISYHGENHREDLGNPSRIYDIQPVDELANLVEKLSGDSTNPLEDFILETMLMGDKGNPIKKPVGSFASSTEIPVYEVFNVILQRPWLLDAITLNAENNPSREAQKRFFSVLFNQPALQQSIRENPAFFISHAEPLNILLERAHKEQKTEQYLFLLYLVQTISCHLEQEVYSQLPQEELTVDNTEIELLNNTDTDIEVLDNADTEEPASLHLEAYHSWPQIHNPQGLQLLSQALDLWKGVGNAKELDTTGKVDGATYITSLFSNSMHSKEPGKITSLQQAENTAKLLECGRFLGIAGESATMPVLAAQAHTWVKESLAPYVDLQCDINQRDAILDKWIGSQCGPIEQGSWQRVAGTSMQWEKGGTRIDLGTLQVMTYNHAPLAGVDVTIPRDVTSHPDYVMLFGTKKMNALVVNGKSPGEFVYTLQIPQADGTNNAYRLLHNTSNGTVTIERQISQQKGNRQTLQWHQLVTPKRPEKNQEEESVSQTKIAKQAMRRIILKETKKEDLKDNLSGIEQNLEKCGVWVNIKDKKKGVAFLGRDGNADSFTIRFDVSLNSDGSINKIMTPDTNKRVVSNKDRELSKVLSCLPEDQIVFLRGKGTRAVDEIRFIGQRISLTRASPQTDWIIHGDENLEGGRWVMGESRAPLANDCLKAFGFHTEDVGFTIEKDGQTTFLLWPQELSPPSALSARLQKSLNFSEKRPFTSPPLRITINEEGEMHSTAAGYLELAYLFAGRREYGMAVLYLEKAQGAKIETKEELEHVFTLQEYLHTLPAHSVRSASIKLKALLTVRRMLMEQSNKPEFSESAWERFLTSATIIDDSFKAYIHCLKDSPFKDKALHYQRGDIDISLNAYEIEELNKINSESLNFIKEVNQQDMPLKPNLAGLNIPTVEEIDKITPLLIASKKKIQKNPQQLLDTLRLDKEHVVDHFFDLYNLIIDRNLTPWDLRMLFSPIPGFNTGEAPTDPLQLVLQEHENSYQLDLARRILLSVASERIDDKTRPRLDLSGIEELKGKLPKNIISLALKTGLAAAFRPKKTNQENPEETVEESSQSRLLSNLMGIIPPFPKEGSLSLSGSLQNIENSELMELVHTDNLNKL